MIQILRVVLLIEMESLSIVKVETFHHARDSCEVILLTTSIRRGRRAAGDLGHFVAESPFAISIEVVCDGHRLRIDPGPRVEVDVLPREGAAHAGHGKAVALAGIMYILKWRRLKFCVGQISDTKMEDRHAKLL